MSKRIDMVKVYEDSLKGTRVTKLDIDYHSKFNVSLLKKHPKNTEYFRDAGSENASGHGVKGITLDNNTYKELVASIKVDGIREPIIIYPDSSDGKYWIISGHRRFTIALQEGFLEVPVGIIRTVLSDDRQAMLIIDSNLHGRVLDSQARRKLRKERLSLYFKIIPGLSSRLEDAIRSKSDEIGYPISATEMAELTGLSEVTTTADLTVLKKITKKKVNAIVYKEKGIDDSTLLGIKKSLGHLKSKIDAANPATRKLALSEVAKWVKKLK